MPGIEPSSTATALSYPTQGFRATSTLQTGRLLTWMLANCQPFPAVMSRMEIWDGQTSLEDGADLRHPPCRLLDSVSPP